MTKTKTKKAWLLEPESWQCPSCGGGATFLVGDYGLVVLLSGIGKLPPSEKTRKLALRRPLSCKVCHWQGKVNDVAQLSKPRRKED